MPIDIVTVPCLSDNYAYLLNDGTTTFLVDAPEAGPIIDALDERNWSLDTILITHHHHDHVGGVADLVARYGCTVTGPRSEQAKLPPIATGWSEGDTGGTGDLSFRVIEVPGHTLGHVAFHFDKAGAMFTADSLMALGCGRVFEGTPEMMWESLSKLMALPPETMVYSGHEYTAANARFALSVDPDNADLQARAEDIEAARNAGKPTAQVPLSLELATNPFLRAHDPALQEALGMQGAPDAAVFAEIRGRKDRF
ncbi:hydroxyacylglutathione hydrolase [Citreimonas sp.]|uniref:hydroxyacylglutathione hydrolase n=1 Tax=Citreimonas sp. TaxID=3036715 RepID=UPI0040592D80